MLRLFTTFCAVAALTLFTSGLRAEDKAAKDQGAKDNKGVQAQITNMHEQDGTVTVKLKDKSGKDVEKTFKLTGAVRYFDSTGRVAALDIFRSGDQVLVVEKEGKLSELHREKQ
jgi:membrane protein implicated in regulation of membrane protease activity